MKRMNIRRITAMTAALIMSLSLISCGSSDGGSAADVKASKAETVENTTSRAETVSKAAEKADDTNGSEDIGLAADDAAPGEKTAAEYGDYGEVEGFDMEARKSIMRSDAALADGERTDVLPTAPGPEADPDTLPGDTVTDPVIDNDAQAFVLTAGEWKDNENWGFFTNLVKSGTVTFPVFGLDPTNRIAVTLTKDGAPAGNQPVELVDKDGKVIWSAMSDKDGKAYVFYKKDQAPALVRSGEASEKVTGGSNEQQGRAGTTEVALNVAGTRKYEDTQVMFILDTTGSMSDEIAYLQMDFASIAKEVDDGRTTFSVNFYRDEEDEYVTRCNPFTNDVKSVQAKINAEYADGGGDIPEAVAEILEETITNNDQWSSSANKIAFLIFDAPPHEGKEQQLDAAVRAAAEKGIRLVPVVSSGAERDTELFGRAIAAQTGGSYVFLTDDSGVGDSHLEPIVGDYEVELLHDVIVRNITELRS